MHRGRMEAVYRAHRGRMARVYLSEEPPKTSGAPWAGDASGRAGDACGTLIRERVGLGHTSGPNRRRNVHFVVLFCTWMRGSQCTWHVQVCFGQNPGEIWRTCVFSVLQATSLLLYSCTGCGLAKLHQVGFRYFHCMGLVGRSRAPQSPPEKYSLHPTCCNLPLPSRPPPALGVASAQDTVTIAMTLPPSSLSRSSGHSVVCTRPLWRALCLRNPHCFAGVGCTPHTIGTRPGGRWWRTPADTYSWGSSPCCATTSVPSWPRWLPPASCSRIWSSRCVQGICFVCRISGLRQIICA